MERESRSFCSEEKRNKKKSKTRNNFQVIFFLNKNPIKFV